MLTSLLRLWRPHSLFAARRTSHLPLQTAALEETKSAQGGGGGAFPTQGVTIVVGWRCSPYVTRDKDAMAAVNASLWKPTHYLLLCVVLDDVFVWASGVFSSGGRSSPPSPVLLLKTGRYQFCENRDNEKQTPPPLPLFSSERGTRAAIWAELKSGSQTLWNVKVGRV